MARKDCLLLILGLILITWADVASCFTVKPSLAHKPSLFNTKTRRVSPTHTLTHSHALTATAESTSASLVPSAAPSTPLTAFHLAHPAFMSAGLATLSSLGLYYGLTVKKARKAAKEGNTTKYSVQQVSRAKDLHPKLMTALLGLYGAGFLGGVISLRTLTNTPTDTQASTEAPTLGLLQSAHAKTGLLSFAMLLAQGALSPRVPEASDIGKKAHSGFGALTMTAMAAHGVAGLKLLSDLYFNKYNNNKKNANNGSA